MAKSRDRVGREVKKPKKDQAAKALTRPIAGPISVDIVPRKRKVREDDEDEESG